MEVDDVRVEQSPKRVRAMLGGEFVADVDGPLLMWERPYYPTYFFPKEAVDTDTLNELMSAKAAHFADKTSDPRLEGFVAFDWDAIDHWFEEDEEVFVHARDPYHRIDTLQSSRAVRVEVAGHVVAESSSPKLLFETGLPTRYYLPKTDVRMELLRESTTSTGCPYKGTARYWGVDIDGTQHDDLAWGYDFPARESAPIAGYVCFYNEHVDLFIDGEPEARPESPFSADKFA